MGRAVVRRRVGFGEGMVAVHVSVGPIVLVSSSRFRQIPIHRRIDPDRVSPDIRVRIRDGYMFTSGLPLFLNWYGYVIS